MNATAYQYHLHMYPEVSGTERKRLVMVREALGSNGAYMLEFKAHKTESGYGTTMDQRWALRADDAYRLWNKQGLGLRFKKWSERCMRGHDFTWLTEPLRWKATYKEKFVLFFQPKQNKLREHAHWFLKACLEGIDAITSFHNKTRTSSWNDWAGRKDQQSVVRNYRVGTRRQAPQ